MRDSPRCQEKTRAGFLPRFARLRLGRAVEHGQKKTTTCSTRSAHARARPRPTPRRAEPRQCPPCAPTPIKPTARAQPHRSSNSPAFARARRVRGHPSPCHRRPANQALPNPVRPSERTEHTSVKLPERGIEVCFAGEASPRSPDSLRPPASIDRVSHCAIFLVGTI
jgi:hypothetical protein